MWSNDNLAIFFIMRIYEKKIVINTHTTQAS